MLGVDTNLLVRLVLDDDPVQSPVVHRVLGRAGVEGIFIGLFVTAELAWVLKRGYREKPEEVLNIIADLLETREFRVERPDLVRAAVADARAAGCGYADALIALMNTEAGAEATLTFDRPAKRLSGMRDAARLK